MLWLFYVKVTLENSQNHDIWLLDFWEDSWIIQVPFLNQGGIQQWRRAEGQLGSAVTLGGRLFQLHYTDSKIINVGVKRKWCWGPLRCSFRKEQEVKEVVSLAIVQPDSFEEVISALSIYCSVLSHVGHCCILLSTGCYLFFRHLQVINILPKCTIVMYITSTTSVLMQLI